MGLSYDTAQADLSLAFNLGFGDWAAGRGDCHWVWGCDHHGLRWCCCHDARRV